MITPCFELQRRSVLKNTFGSVGLIPSKANTTIVGWVMVIFPRRPLVSQRVKIENAKASVAMAVSILKVSLIKVRLDMYRLAFINAHSKNRRLHSNVRLFKRLLIFCFVGRRFVAAGGLQ
jgi:hypothetical protein